MDQFFTPTRRLQDTYEEYYSGPFEYSEVQLAVPLEEFLDYHWDWKDLCAFASSDVIDKILWITDGLFLVVDIFHTSLLWESLLHASSTASSGQEQRLTLAKPVGESISEFTKEVDVFWRAMTRSSCARVRIVGNHNYSSGLPSGPLLSQYLRKSPSLQTLELCGIDFKEEHCRALSTLWTDIEIKAAHYIGRQGYFISGFATIES
jgi:hypothetical protein